MGTQIRFVDGKILFVDGKIAFDDACCCEEEDCETNCLAGTVPPEFELVVPTGVFNPFIGCGATCLDFAGTFVLTYYGSVGGICRWTYCMEDPCNPGKYAMYVLSYRLPNRAVLLLVYGLDSCDDLAWSNWNEWQATIGGPGDIDCCTIDDEPLDYFIDSATPNCAIFAATRPRITALC